LTFDDYRKMIASPEIDIDAVAISRRCDGRSERI